MIGPQIPIHFASTMLNAQYNHGDVLFLFCFILISAALSRTHCATLHQMPRSGASAEFLYDVTPKINVSVIIKVPIYYVLPTLAKHGSDH